MADFSKALPEWNDPGIEPPQQVKDTGWNVGTRPPASYFDWLQYTTYHAVKELQENALHISKSGDLTSLTTTNKASLVSAINELKSSGDTRGTKIGDTTALSTTVKTSLVLAINELDAEHGVLSSLSTTAKNNFVSAINELKNKSDEIGTISGLTTTAKNNLVAALNELDSEIGSLSGLSTTAKNTLIAAINELKTKADGIGTISGLTTTTKTNLVSALNELDAEVGNLSSLNTTAKNTLIAAINELKGKTDGIGTLSGLATTDKTNLVSALNEVNGKTSIRKKGLFVSSGNGSATSLQIPHTLGSNPTFYSVQEASLGAGAATISYVTSDAVSLSVTFKNALPSGTNNISLVWMAE